MPAIGAPTAQGIPDFFNNNNRGDRGDGFDWGNFDWGSGGGGGFDFGNFWNRDGKSGLDGLADLDPKSKKFGRHALGYLSQMFLPFLQGEVDKFGELQGDRHAAMDRVLKLMDPANNENKAREFGRMAHSDEARNAARTKSELRRQGFNEGVIDAVDLGAHNKAETRAADYLHNVMSDENQLKQLMATLNITDPNQALQLAGFLSDLYGRAGGLVPPDGPGRPTLAEGIINAGLSIGGGLISKSLGL